MRHKPAFVYAIIFFVLLFLSGCGGGGGGRGTAIPGPEPELEQPVSPPPPPPCIQTHEDGCLSVPDFETEASGLAQEYRDNDLSFDNQWGLDTINADWAYANVELLEGKDAKPGAGVTIGFIDTGIDTGHPAFDGKTVTEVFLDGATDETGVSFSHGTAVASVAAGLRAGSLASSANGVAWGADIAMFAIPTGSGGGNYRPISLAGLSSVDSTWASQINFVLNWRDGQRTVDFLNLSVGHSGIIDSYSEQELRDNFGTAIAAMAQAGAGEKTILIWNAGNAHEDPCDPTVVAQCENDKVNAVSVEVLPGLVARIPELRGHSLAVAALRPADAMNNIPEGIAIFSNRCGIAADYCLAAPGRAVKVAYFGPDSGDVVRNFDDRSGTSFAAPMVAGGLAVMKQLFRAQLSNTALVTRLLTMADKSGDYADSAVYGQGLMDLKAATSPVDVLEVTLGTQVDGPGIDLRTTGMRPGAAFGDGLRRSFAGREIVAFDRLGAPFWFDLGRFATAAAGPSSTTWLRDFMAPASSANGTDFAGGAFRIGRSVAPGQWRLGFSARPAARASHLALAERTLNLTFAHQNGLSVAAFTTEGVFGQPPTSGATLSWRPTGSPLGLRAGWLGERKTLLGGTAQGAFGNLAAGTAFVGVEAETVFGGWRLGANAESGTVSPAARGGVIDAISSLRTSTFTLHASRPLAHAGTVRVSISQPLRVEHGQASLTVPAGRTKAGEVVRIPMSAQLAPSGRQIDVAVHWYQPLAMGELRLGAVATHQPGHRATAGPELTLLSGWRWIF